MNTNEININGLTEVVLNLIFDLIKESKAISMQNRTPMPKNANPS